MEIMNDKCLYLKKKDHLWKKNRKTKVFVMSMVIQENKNKKDSFYMIECAKEISIRLYSIKFTLSIIIDLELSWK